MKQNLIVTGYLRKLSRKTIICFFTGFCSFALYFISLRPTTSGLEKNLELTCLEKSIFERPNEPI